MKIVIIATTNNDKFVTVKKIFEATIFPKEKYRIESLNTLNIKLKNQKEIGNNIERARQKAIFARKELTDFDLVVGLDDAIRIKGKLEPNIKEYITKILYEDYISDGEEYSFSRAYCIIDKNNNIYETTAEIPYIYHSDKLAIINDNSYPLSQVAYPIDYDIPINKLTDKQELEYYLKYVKEALKTINIQE